MLNSDNNNSRNLKSVNNYKEEKYNKLKENVFIYYGSKILE